MPRPVWVALLLVLVAVLSVGGFLAVDRLAGDDGAGVETKKPELGTVAVVSTDLERSESFPGVLRYADPQIVFAVVEGIVTKISTEGAQVSRGDPIFEIDGQSVFVFYGERPMWRWLGPAPDGTRLEGTDVEQLELNLEALGYSPRSRPDRVFDDGSARLVRNWRADAGLSDSDSVELGRIVYVDGPVKVSRSLVELGTPVVPGTPIVEVSKPVQEVRMELPADRRNRISFGAAVAVRLPDDARATGTVQAIGSVVLSTSPDRRGTDYIEVIIHLDDPRLGEPYYGYPVDIDVVTDRVAGVLAVPVKALVALSEGGYGVEVERDGMVSLVGVETGMYAGGLVEVRGDLDPGDLVRVPR